MKPIRTWIVGCAVAIALSVSTASADTILKFGLSEIGPDVLFESGIFGTRDDGNLATTGDQNTAINYTGFLDPVLADILSGASLSIDNIAAVGSAQQDGSVILQQTDGGTFGVWNEANELLLSGEFGEGLIAGTSTANTGSFFNSEVVNYTGGSLLTYILPAPGGLSLSLASITTGSEVGLRVIDGELQEFTANSNGLITGEPVPEPSTALLMLSGVLGFAAKRRREE